MKILRIVFAFFFSVGVLSADSFLQDRLLRQCTSGNARGIGSFCRDTLRACLDRDKLDETSLDKLLENKEVAQVCYMGRYFEQINQKKSLILNELRDKEFSAWLLKNPAIFEKLVFSNRASSQTLDIVHRIWLLENKELNGLSLNMALGIGLAVHSMSPEICLEKYNFYKKSQAEKKLFVQFETLEPWELEIVFRGSSNFEDLAWGQEFLASKKQVTAENAGYSGCFLIPYRHTNKRGINVQSGAAFYDYKPVTLKIYVEYGGVCGALSESGRGFLTAKGVPSYTIGQPGHCALVWKESFIQLFRFGL